MNCENKSRDGFSSKMGFLLSSIGFAAGISSLWRFPYVCGENGGGLYLIVYSLFVIVLGIPLYSAEVAIGMASQKSPVGAYESLTTNKKWKAVGYINILAIIFASGYTMPVYGWIYSYLISAFTGELEGMTASQLTEHYNELSVNYPILILLVLISLLVSVLIIRNNLKNGLEKIVKPLLPLRIAVIVVLAVYAVTLPNGIEGVKFLFLPNFENFGINSILSALGQALFSLGIGMAVIIVFGSYQKPGQSNVIKNSAVISFSVIIISILSGLVIFPIVFSFGLTPDVGAGLTFVVMPNAFNMMKGGYIWGILFYTAFAIAAFLSNIAGLEAIVSFFMDKFNISRKKAIVFTVLSSLAIGIPSIYSTKIFSAFDFIMNNVLLVGGTFLMSIFVGWIWGIDKFAAAAGFSDNRIIYTAVKITVKYISPVTIFVLIMSMFI